MTEKLYGPSSEYDNGDAEPSGMPRDYKTEIPFTPITNLNLGYQFTHFLFNRFPPHHNGTILAHEWAADDGAYESWYPIFSPFSIDGGYYYTKASITI